MLNAFPANSRLFGLTLGTVLALATDAGAVNGAVRTACQADYFAYCSQHDPDGAEVRQCMRANGRRLSRGCLDALIAAGEVSKTEIARRSKTGR
jgi:hypothetical protein